MEIDIHYIKYLSNILGVEYEKLQQSLKDAKVLEFYYDFFELKPYMHIYDIYDFDIERIENSVREYLDFVTFIEGVTIRLCKLEDYYGFHYELIETLGLENKNILFTIEVICKDSGIIFFVYT